MMMHLQGLYYVKYVLCRLLPDNQIYSLQETCVLAALLLCKVVWRQECPRITFLFDRMMPCGRKYTDI